MSHACKPGEIQVGTKYYGRQPGDASLADELEDSSGGEEEADAGALEDSDSGGC